MLIKEVFIYEMNKNRQLGSSKPVAVAQYVADIEGNVSSDVTYDGYSGGEW